MLRQQQIHFYDEKLRSFTSMIHGSSMNLSQEARTTLLVQMRDPEDPPTVKTHESRGQGMMLRGYDPTALPPEAQPRSM
jgi:hypothetical protein